MFTVTAEWLENHKTKNGGYFAAHAYALGISYPFVKGWKKRLIGKEISDAQKAAFEAGAVSKSQARKANKIIRTLERKKRKQEARDFVQKAQEVGYQQARTEWEAAGKSRGRAGRPKYDGGVMSDAFLSSYEWRKIRMVALKKYGTKCQCCGATPADGAVMNVDHIKPRRIFPDLALDVNNLQVLCHECNHGKGNWDMTDWRKTEAI